MVELITLGLPVVTAGFVVATTVGIAKLNWKFSDFKKNNEEDHADIWLAQEKVLDVYSNYNRIRKVAKEVGKHMSSDDAKLAVFVQVCVDVTLDFYDLVIVGGIETMRERDLVRGSNTAIQTCANAAQKAFSLEFINIFWNDFENRAAAIRPKLLDIINGTRNSKEDRLTRAIEDYLFDQLSSINDLRKDYIKHIKAYDSEPVTHK